MCPSPPRDLRERDSKHKRYGIEVFGDGLAETNVLILERSPGPASICEQGYASDMALQQLPDSCPD